MKQKFVKIVIAAFALTLLASCCNHKQEPAGTASSYDSKEIKASGENPRGTTGPRGGRH